MGSDINLLESLNKYDIRINSTLSIVVISQMFGRARLAAGLTAGALLAEEQTHLHLFQLFYLL
jgi:hypothetical protein